MTVDPLFERDGRKGWSVQRFEEQTMNTHTDAAAGLAQIGMRRVVVIPFLSWLLLSWTGVADVRAETAADRPNFVLMMCDDLGWGDTGFNGNRVIRTPSLDAMAKSGMVFRRFYAASAVCSPTRGSVLTGRHPYRYGVTTANTGHLRSGELTLAELLRELGYATGHFGKWHLGTMSRTVVESNRGGPRGAKNFAPPWINGFQVCFSTEAKLPTYDPMWKPRQGAGKRGWDFIADRAQAELYGTHYWNQDAQQVTDNLDGDDSRVIMDRVVPFVQRAAQQKQPFLAVVWFHTPHLPVVAGPRHAGMYAEHDSYPRNYFGCVTAMDEQVGRLRRVLRDLGVSENTLLAFCSDNGPEGKASAPGSAGRFRGRKRDLYEGGIRVPAVVEWPQRVAAGSATDYPAVTSDFLPTILDILQWKLPARRPIDGVSLVPVLAQEQRQRPVPIGFEFAGKLALSDNRYKIVSYPPAGTARSKKKQAPQNAIQSRTFELYDLLEDPGESRNIAEHHPQLVRDMVLRLSAWRKSCQVSAGGADYPHSDSQP